jgi:hypothetical protein
MTRMKTDRHIALSCLAIMAATMVVDGALQSALAQNPFSGPPAAPDAQVGGIVGWLLTKQSEFYREMSSTIRAAKADGSAVWTLLAISFGYGMFHAAGPGHGKTVISSYLVANEETARRGIVLSFVSALMQSLIAVLIVGLGAWLLNVTAKTMCGAERVIEIASYTLIAAFGSRLVWTKGGGLIRALQSSHGKFEPRLAPALAHGQFSVIMDITRTAMATTDIIITPTPLRTQLSLPIMCLNTNMRSITITAMSTTSIAGIPTVLSPRNSAVPAAGGAVSARFSPSASDPVQALFWFWCSRWRRECSGPASPPRS